MYPASVSIFGKSCKRFMLKKEDTILCNSGSLKSRLRQVCLITCLPTFIHPRFSRWCLRSYLEPKFELNCSLSYRPTRAVSSRKLRFYGRTKKDHGLLWFKVIWHVKAVIYTPNLMDISTNKYCLFCGETARCMPKVENIFYFKARTVYGLQLYRV